MLPMFLREMADAISMLNEEFLRGKYSTQELKLAKQILFHALTYQVMAPQGIIFHNSAVKNWWMVRDLEEGVDTNKSEIWNSGRL